MRQNKHYRKIPSKQTQVNLRSTLGLQHYNNGHLWKLQGEHY